MHEEDEPTYDELVQDTIPFPVAGFVSVSPLPFRNPYPAVVQRRQQVLGAGIISDVAAMITRAADVIGHARRGRIRRVQRYIEMWENRQEETE